MARVPGRRPAGRAGAFTLVEVLVVIGIIGLLLTIVTPGLQQARQRGRVVACASNLRQIHLVISPYVERRGTLPRLENRGSRSEATPTLDTVFADEAGGTHIYRCPSDRAGLYEESGCSYFWNFLVNGQAPERIFLLTRYISGHFVPMVADKESFHPTLEDKVNILYADGHVAPGLMDYYAAP